MLDPSFFLLWPSPSAFSLLFVCTQRKIRCFFFLKVRVGVKLPLSLLLACFPVVAPLRALSPVSGAICRIISGFSSCALCAL